MPIVRNNDRCYFPNPVMARRLVRATSRGAVLVQVARTSRAMTVAEHSKGR